MIPEIFNFWYSSLELQPPTMDLFSTCTQNPICQNCPKRSGCPIRPLFYMDELMFETYLQSSEIDIGNFLSKITDDESEKLSNIAFISSEKIRIKRAIEIAEHKTYSDT